MNRKLILAFFLIILAIPGISKEISRPKLVVGIVVDQMRWDYLYRYYDRYGNDGFKRLMNEGFNCQQAMIIYLRSFTAPGHSCVYTGSVPALHGIAGNFWVEGGKLVYCTDDKSVTPVGGSYVWGQMSPRNLNATTITDELRLATNFRSRTFGISLKDRSSILPAGHLASGAFWFDDSTGNFMTSSYYRNGLPRWVQTFNERRLPDSLLSKDWTLLQDRSLYRYSTADQSPYEGKYSNNEQGTTFPHAASHFMGSGAYRYNSLRKLPAGNWITLQLARACIREEGLGTKADPDFLAVSLSATDYAGHQFGPNALEMEDMYIRLDEEIARFLHYLDNNIGEGQYVVFLTADHGAAHNADFLKDNKIPSANLFESKMRDELSLYLQKEGGKDSLIPLFDNNQVYINEEVVARRGIDKKALKEKITAWLLQHPEVAYTIDLENISASSLPEPIHAMTINGYHRGRSGSIEVILKPGAYFGYSATGTTHGTWNPYDTHIPLLWYGWHIPQGSTNRRVDMTDISATLAALLHIQMPNACIGKVITEIAP
jgi:predicted AlkP superfamily pyrophosphatase or phosphodiesterase